MITINKAVVSRVPPGQVQALIGAVAADADVGPAVAAGPGEDLAAARLRDLAVRLAAYRDLQVSVITYEDGRAELEVLHAGPPHHTEDTIDCAKFAGPDRPTPGWIVSLADDDALQRAMDLVRDTLLNASGPRTHDGRASRPASSATSASARSRTSGT